MSEYKSTIVLTMGTSQYESIQCGNILQLMPDENNEHDADAIAAYLDGKQIGYVANSKSTVLPGSLGATRLKDLLTRGNKVSTTSALLVEETPYTAPSGVEQRRFIANLFFVPNRTASPKPIAKRQTFLVGGGTVKNAGKTAITAMLTKAQEDGTACNIPLVIRKTGDGNMFSYRLYDLSSATPETPCGEVVTEEPDDLKDLADWLDQHDSLSCNTVGSLVNKFPSGNALRGGGYEVTAEFKPVDQTIFDADVDAAIKHCAGQEPDIREKLSFMLAQNVAEGVIRKVLRKMKPLCASDIPEKPPRPFLSAKPVLSDALAFTMLGKHLRLYGDKGSGKNTLIETMCWLMNQPMLRIQGNEELDKMDLMGSFQLSDGQTMFELGDAMKALQEGKTVVIDEANLIRPSVLGILHSATDTARSVLVPGYGLVRLADTAQVVYTMNEGYAGTSDMNEATVDRCPAFELEPEVRLSAILAAYPADVVSQCQKVSDEINKAVGEGTLNVEAVTIRGYIDACDSIDLMPLKRALEYCIAKKIQDKAQRITVEGIIANNCA